MAISRQRKSMGLPIAACVVALLVLPLAAMFIRAVLYLNSFQTFVEEMSDATVYAFYHEGVRVTNRQGEAYTAGGRAVYIPYSLISQAGPGQPQREIPDQACVTVEYGDGSRLQLWEVPVKNSRRSARYGMLVCFESAGGERFLYDTDMVRLPEVERGLLAGREDS